MATKVTVESIKELNKRIEKINTARTKTETRIEMLNRDLSEKIAEYKKKYGVDLQGKDFKETASKIKSEASVTAESVQKEYELKEKVVSCIESGDIEQASKLLGISEPEEDVKEEPEKPVSKKVVPEGMSPVEDMVVEDSDEPIVEDDSDDIVIEDDIKLDSTGDLVVEDDDDDSDDPFGFGFGEMLDGTKF